MNRELFTQAVHDKAKELKITPKLLLFAVIALAENSQVIEQDVFKSYFKSMIEDMREAALEQIKSNNKKRREAGEEALKPMDESLLPMCELLGSTINLDLSVHPPLLNLSSVAINNLAADRIKIIKKAGHRTMDTIQCIRALCPDLVQKAKEFSNLFENDLNLN